jgi:hypothetical protein
MLDRMKIAIAAALIAMPALCPWNAIAQTVIYPAHITEVITGWNSDDVGISTDVPIVNPANCPICTPIPPSQHWITNTRPSERNLRARHHHPPLLQARVQTMPSD